MNHPPDTNAASDRQDRHLTEGACRGLLNGFLSPAEQVATLRHLAACPACERSFRERVIERENLRSLIALRSGPDGEVVFERLQEQMSDEATAKDPLLPDARHGEQTEAAPAGLDRLQPRWADSVAATLRSLWAGLCRPRYQVGLGLVAIAVVLILLVWPHQKERQALTLYWMPVSSEGSSVRSTAKAASNPDLAAGIDAYAARDLDLAITLLQGAQTSGQNETLRKVFLASALAWSGNHADAVSILRTVRAQTLPDPWGSEARWTLYLSLRECGPKATADSLLRVLAQEQGEVGDRARRLRHR